MRELLLLPQSKNNILEVVNFIGNSRKKYVRLIDFIAKNESVMSSKASWAMSHCYDNNLGFFVEHLPTLLPILKDENYSDSIKRNIVRVLQIVEIPKNHHGEVVNSCFGLLNDRKKPAAILAFSMTVLYNMTKIYPE